MCALTCAIVTVQPRFHTPKGRTIRFLLYIALGVSSCIPAVHGVTAYGFAEHNKRMGLEYFIKLAFLNFTGACIYASRVPERWLPGVFDIVGASHQLMHLMVLLGATSCGLGLVGAFEFWNGVRAMDGGIGAYCAAAAR